jgi:hypothetical protein
MAEVGVGGKVNVSDAEVGVFGDLGPLSLELNADRSGPFLELGFGPLHITSRSQEKRYVLAALRTVAALGTSYIGNRTWGRAYDYDGKFREWVVLPGESPGAALWAWQLRGLLIKMFPEGQFEP